MSSANATSAKLHFEFAAEGGDHFLVEARLETGAGNGWPLILDDIRFDPGFRAVCILLLLAKFRYGEKKDCSFDFAAASASKNWLQTLGGMRLNGNHDWFKTHFKCERAFFSAYRANKKTSRTAHVEYLPGALPPDHVRFTTKMQGSTPAEDLLGADLARYAQKLELEGWENHDEVAHVVGWKPRIIAGNVVKSSASRKEIYQGFPHERGDFHSHAQPLHGWIVTGRHESDEEGKAIELLEKKPDLRNGCLNEYGDSPLILAIGYHRRRVVDYLLSLNDVNLNHKSAKGQSALLKAAFINSFELVKQLVEKGADPATTNNENANGIYEAAFGATQNSLPIIEFLSQYTACNVTCLDGTTAWTTALQRKCPEKTLRFLAARCQKDSAEIRPTNEQRQKLFQQYEKDYNGFVSSPDPYPVHTMARENNENELAEFMQGYQADNWSFANQVEPIFGNTPLHIAVELGHESFAWDLITYMANPFIQNHQGRTAREIFPLDLQKMCLLHESQAADKEDKSNKKSPSVELHENLRIRERLLSMVGIEIAQIPEAIKQLGQREMPKDGGR